MELQISIQDPTGPDAALLIEHLSMELGSRYGDNGAGAFGPHDVQVPRAAFVIAYVDGRPLGCGALKPFDSETPNIAEIKRMFVEPDMRGQGFSRLILARLEQISLEFGYDTIRLETGLKQPEAIGLYERSGFSRIPCYGDYAQQTLSVCFEKQISK
jgi:GNAT superfamily N-acetyltransferase